MRCTGCRPESAECGITDALDAHDFAACEQADGHEATVDGAIRGLAVGVALDDGDRARAAIALGAAFLRAGQAAAAQKFQQRRVRRNLFNSNRLAIQNEFKKIGHDACNCFQANAKSSKRQSRMRDSRETGCILTLFLIFPPLPARHERGGGRGEGRFVRLDGPPLPNPLLSPMEERESE